MKAFESFVQVLLKMKRYAWQNTEKLKIID